MKLATAFVVLIALPCAALADDFDYTFVEGGIVNEEIDAGPFDIDGDGFGLNGSFALAGNMLIVGGYSDLDYDFGLDGSVMNVGAGFHTGLTQDLDFVADISYVDAEIASGMASVDEDGYRLGAGLRARAGNKLELEAGLSYLDLDSSDTSVRVGGRWYFSDAFAAGLGLTDNDGGLSWTLGLRAEFGNR